MVVNVHGSGGLVERFKGEHCGLILWLAKITCVTLAVWLSKWTLYTEAVSESVTGIDKVNFVQLIVWLTD